MRPQKTPEALSRHLCRREALGACRTHDDMGDIPTHLNDIIDQGTRAPDLYATYNTGP